MRVCLDVLTIKDVADDRILSVYPSIYLPLVYRYKRRDKCLYVVWLTNITIPIRISSFSLSFAFLSTEQGLRNKNVCVMLSYAAVHVSFVKNIVCN